MNSPVYLDYNATTPPHPEVLARLLDWTGLWGNPSSIHWAGRGPKSALRQARESVAAFLGVHPLEIVFTSGGSEANSTAIQGLCESPSGGRDQVVISAVEHPSVRRAALSLTRRGYRVDTVGVNRLGQLDLAQLDGLLSERTALVSVMLANNETGHIFPVAEVSRRAHAVGARVHCDAVQALGKIPLHLPSLGVDVATFSAHKFYALRGCGVLYVRAGTNINCLIDGGGQERGRRGGTENALAIASLGLMCSRQDEIESQGRRLACLRNAVESRLQAEIAGVRVTGAVSVPRLPNTSSLVIDGVDGETLLMNLDVRGFAVSTGAACSSGSPEPSPALLAMGLSRAEAQSSLRLSLGWPTTPFEVETFVDELKKVVTRLRSFSDVGEYVLGI